MPLTLAEPRQAGRPRSTPGTIRILPSGAIRLSPDLCVAKTFAVYFDKTKRQIVLRKNGEWVLWYSSKHARSGLLTLSGVFREMGVSPKQVAREYKVLIKGGDIILEL